MVVQPSNNFVAEGWYDIAIIWVVSMKLTDILLLHLRWIDENGSSLFKQVSSHLDFTCLAILLPYYSAIASNGKSKLGDLHNIFI